MAKTQLVGFVVMYSFKERRSQNLCVGERLPETDQRKFGQLIRDSQLFAEQEAALAF